MTVAELIAALSEFPQDATVWVNGNSIGEELTDSFELTVFDYYAKLGKGPPQVWIE